MMLKLNLIRTQNDLPKSKIIYDVDLKIVKIKPQGTNLEKKYIRSYGTRKIFRTIIFYR